MVNNSFFNSQHQGIDDDDSELRLRDEMKLEQILISTHSAKGLKKVMEKGREGVRNSINSKSVTNSREEVKNSNPISLSEEEQDINNTVKAMKDTI